MVPSEWNWKTPSLYILIIYYGNNFAIDVRYFSEKPLSHVYLQTQKSDYLWLQMDPDYPKKKMGKLSNVILGQCVLE